MNELKPISSEELRALSEHFLRWIHEASDTAHRVFMIQHDADDDGFRYLLDLFESHDFAIVNIFTMITMNGKLKREIYVRARSSNSWDGLLAFDG